MLVFEDSFINAEDYLALISGCPVQHIRDRRPKDNHRFRLKGLNRFNDSLEASSFPFLTEKSQRPVEALYLKVILLEELLNRVGNEVLRITPREFGFSADCIWLRIHAPLPAVPFAWRFSVSIIEGATDVAGFGHDNRLKEPPGYGWYALSALWFHVLLEDGREQQMDIPRQLRDPLVHVPRNGGLSEWVGKASVGLSVQLTGMTESFRGLEPVLSSLVSSGIRLRETAENPESLHVTEEIKIHLAGVKRLVLAALRDGGVHPVSEERRPTDHDIYNVLISIRNQWRDKRSSPVGEADETETVIVRLEDSTPTPENQEKILETVILTAEGTAPDLSKNQDRKGDLFEDRGISTPDDEFPETVIVASRERPVPAEPMAENREAASVSEEEEMMATVLIGKGMDRDTSVSPVTDELTETIVLGGKTPLSGTPIGQGSGGKDHASSDDTLMETVLVRPGTPMKRSRE